MITEKFPKKPFVDNIEYEDRQKENIRVNLQYFLQTIHLLITIFGLMYNSVT